MDNRDDFIEFIYKWVERGLFSQTTSAEAALKIIAHHPSAPWYNPTWEWDVRHKEYAEGFYKEFPRVGKLGEKKE